MKKASVSGFPRLLPGVVQILGSLLPIWGFILMPLGLCAAVKPAPPARVVVILADDLGWPDLGVFGDGWGFAVEQ